jgi:hypothetical protein
VTYHLTDELVAQNHVSVDVVDHPGTTRRDGVVVVHEVYVGGADRRGQRSQQEFTFTRNRVGGLAYFEAAVS